MPKYRVQLSDGRIVTVEADQPPTEDQILAQLGPAQAPQTEAPADPLSGPLTRENFGATMADADTQFQAKARAAGEALPMAGGMVGAAFGGVPGAVLGGAGGAAFRQLDRRLAGQQAPATATEAATDIGLEGGKQAAMELGGRAVTAGGRLLYKGGVALLPKGIKQSNPNIASRGFKEGISLTRRGANKAQGLVSGSRQQADDMIAAAERGGAPAIPPMEVVRELRPVGSHIRNETALGAADDMPALVRRSRSFIDQNRGGIPVTRGQTLKRTAQGRANTAYKARDRGAVINSNEALTDEAQAHGLRLALERRVPDVGAVNQRTQELGGVLQGAEHASETGHGLMRLGGAGIGGALLGAGGGFVPAVAGAALGPVLTTPGGLTSAGLLMKRGGQVGPDALRAALMAMLAQEGEQ